MNCSKKICNPMVHTTSCSGKPLGCSDEAFAFGEELTSKLNAEFKSNTFRKMGYMNCPDQNEAGYFSTWIYEKDFRVGILATNEKDCKPLRKLLDKPVYTIVMDIHCGQYEGAEFSTYEEAVAYIRECFAFHKKLLKIHKDFVISGIIPSLQNV